MNGSKKDMKKMMIVAIFLVIFCISCDNSSDNDYQDSLQTESTNSKSIEKKVTICDGINVTMDCEFDGIQYSVYRYYPATQEKSHIEKVTTYTKEIVGHCTSCNDGTYSPSCATGKGACSHHDGVKEWNAPIYKDVPHYEEKVIIDSPAVAERYEKIIKDN